MHQPHLCSPNPHLLSLFLPPPISYSIYLPLIYHTSLVAPAELATSQADVLEDALIDEIAHANILPPSMPYRISSQESIDTLSASPLSTTGVQSRSSSSSSQPPPSFSDLVKRSTRFITSVPAQDVLQKVMRVLEGCRLDGSPTAIGVIGRVELNWESYRIEVWNTDIQVHTHTFSKYIYIYIYFPSFVPAFVPILFLSLFLLPIFAHLSLFLFFSLS